MLSLQYKPWWKRSNLHAENDSKRWSRIRRRNFPRQKYLRPSLRTLQFFAREIQVDVGGIVSICRHCGLGKKHAPDCFNKDEPTDTFPRKTPRSKPKRDCDWCLQAIC